MLRPTHIAMLPLLAAVASASCQETPHIRAELPRPIYAPMRAPSQSATFTASNEVRALDWDGLVLWAATAGGVLRFQGGQWTKWTRRDGLPANEAFGLERQGKYLSVLFAASRARFEGGAWRASAAPEWQTREPRATWKGRAVVATLQGLVIGGKAVPLPAQTSGTHITALLPRSKSLLAAVYGDGLWAWDGASWARGPQLPGGARDALALAGDEDNVWLGTRRNGIYRLQRGAWKKIEIGSAEAEPLNHNVQFLAEFGGVLWASTLDDGLAARTGAGWRHAAPPSLSSSAPRQMVTWRGQLYVRHGNGAVDAFDGAKWARGALAGLPRRGVYSLARDDSRLLAGGWGGWAEWDGSAWSSFYDLPGLRGAAILSLAAQGDDVWIGTQNRGLALWKRSTGDLRFFDERDGLRDDWITALLVDGERVWAGTFSGGLQLFQGGHWRLVEATAGQGITSLATDGSGGVWAATRHGIFHADAEGQAKKADLKWLDEEAQALWRGEGGLWIGTRTSLNFWKADAAPASTPSTAPASTTQQNAEPSSLAQRAQQ